MPYRLTRLVTGYYYHIYNRGVNKQNIFEGKRDYQRALEILEFYQCSKPPFKFSRLRTLSLADQRQIWIEIHNREKLVEIVCYCLMPNHYHLVFKQAKDGGISKFIANWQNSYARYFNTKRERVGPLFQGPFKVVKIDSDNQLMHLSRYIHLNPYTAYLVSDIADLEEYPWSSLPEYLGRDRNSLCQKDVVMTRFQPVKKYQQFMNDQAKYQRELDRIKHLVLEK